jgi:serine protease Do
MGDETRPGQKIKAIDAQRAKFLSLVLLILLSTSAGFLGGWIGSERRSTGVGGTATEQRQVILKESQVISDIAKQAGPSVVSVNVTSQSTQTDLFFGFTNPVEQQSAGTGIIISADGYVLTNRHVVPAGAQTVSVTLSDGTELTDVQVVGRTNDSDPLDIAFLKIKDKKGKELKPAKIGNSSKVQVGDKVVAIGNALGQFQNTVTSGIISGYGRNVQAGDSQGSNSETLQNLFQTDAAINEGNSGGPLVNINGEVIGVNTAIAGNGAENIGFAIPINDVQGLIKSVLEKGKLERPYLGVRYVSLTDDYAYQFNLNVKRGAYIVPSTGGRRSILPGSPAEKAGLKEKDIITKIDGTAIDENNTLTSLLGKHSVGDEVSLTIVRNGKEQTVKVKLEASPNS